MSTSKLSLQAFNNLYSNYFYDDTATNFDSFVSLAQSEDDNIFNFFPFALNKNSSDSQKKKANEYFAILNRYFESNLLEEDVTKSDISDSMKNVLSKNHKYDLNIENADEIIDTYISTEDNLKGLKVPKIKSQKTFAKRLLTASVAMGVLGGLFGAIFALIGGVAGGATIFEKLMTNEIVSTIINHVAVCGGISAIITAVMGSALHGIFNTYYKTRYKFKKGIETYAENEHAPICELIDTIKKDDAWITEHANSNNPFTKIQVHNKKKINRNRLHAIKAYLSYLIDSYENNNGDKEKIKKLYEHLQTELLDLVGDKYFDALDFTTPGNTVEYIDTLIVKKHQSTIQKRGQVQNLVLQCYKRKLATTTNLTLDSSNGTELKELPDEKIDRHAVNKTTRPKTKKGKYYGMVEDDSLETKM